MLQEKARSSSAWPCRRLLLRTRTQENTRTRTIEPSYHRSLEPRTLLRILVSSYPRSSKPRTFYLTYRRMNHEPRTSMIALPPKTILPKNPRTNERAKGRGKRSEVNTRKNKQTHDEHEQIHILSNTPHRIASLPKIISLIQLGSIRHFGTGFDFDFERVSLSLSSKKKTPKTKQKPTNPMTNKPKPKPKIQN